MRAPVTAEFVHGATGLDGADLPAPTVPLARLHAVDALIELLRARPAGSVTLCALGPLTNLALALHKAPEIAGRIREIVLMGGALGEGNITPAAEFNIYADPHAAKVVFEAGVPLVMHGLDVTHQALVTPARLAAIQALGTPVSAAVAGLLEVLRHLRPDPPRPPRRPAPRPLHDRLSTAAGAVRRPRLPRRDRDPGRAHDGPHGGRLAGRGRLNRGAAPPNAKVMNEIDADGFFRASDRAFRALAVRRSFVGCANRRRHGAIIRLCATPTARSSMRARSRTMR